MYYICNMKLKAYKYQLNPQGGQFEMLNKHFGCSRFVYNWGLNRKSEEYAKTKKNISCFDLIKEITLLKKEEEYKWLSEIQSQTLQMSLRCLDNAFTSFFHKKSEYPNFHKKKNRQSFQYPQGVKIKDNMIYLPKIGWIKYFKDKRDLNGIIKTVTVSKTPTNKYYVSVLCQQEEEYPEKKEIKQATAVGIDLGVKDLAITSNGEVFENKKYLGRNLSRLRIEQRKLQRCKKGSNRREKQRMVVARLYEKITNERNDYLHKITTSLVNEYDTIVMEDLNIKGMMQNKHLSRSIGEMGWSIMLNMFKYKCEQYGKNFIQIGMFEPSSKRCHNCGYINKDLKLSDREWICPKCGKKQSRDIGAALNIRDYGLGTQPSDAKVVH